MTKQLLKYHKGDVLGKGTRMHFSWVYIGITSIYQGKFDRIYKLKMHSLFKLPIPIIGMCPSVLIMHVKWQWNVVYKIKNWEITKMSTNNKILKSFMV